MTNDKAIKIFVNKEITENPLLKELKCGNISYILIDIVGRAVSFVKYAEEINKRIRDPFYDEKQELLKKLG